MSATIYGLTPGAGTGQAIFTNDISLQVFMEHLKRLACPSVCLVVVCLCFTRLFFSLGCWCSNKLKITY